MQGFAKAIRKSLHGEIIPQDYVEWPAVSPGDVEKALADESRFGGEGGRRRECYGGGKPVFRSTISASARALFPLANE
jgi:hypothetical protein